MTEHAYDVVERFRDLGGRLIFLSANNFFWKVEKQGRRCARIKLWRDDGRPEARLCGVQYRANDDGTRQGPFDVVAADAAPWLFEETGLATGSTFGEMVGGYGIEIDSTTPDSPPGTMVLARIPSLFGPGLTARWRTTRRPPAPASSRPACSTSVARPRSGRCAGCSRTCGSTCSRTCPSPRPAARRDAPPPAA